MKELIKVDGGKIDQTRPKERPPKSNWRLELFKRLLWIYQYPAPKTTAKIIWGKFSKPGRSKFNSKQEALTNEAKITPINYKGHKVYHYQWGQSETKIILSHGWNSKIADFRKMILALVKAGYQVEGIDMKAHGKSEGIKTALPEMVEILLEQHKEFGPYHAAIGYSIGGLAAGMTIYELPDELRPKHFIKIAAPHYTRFFFEETIKQYGFRHKVYEKMADMVGEHFKNPIDYYDLRDKTEVLDNIHVLMIYDEDDKTITIDRGRSFVQYIPHATFIQSKGLGHYQVIANEQIINKIITQLEIKEDIPNFSMA